MTKSLFDSNEGSLRQLERALQVGAIGHSDVLPDTHELVLGAAIRRGNAAACRLLLQAGADPNKESLLNTSPAWAAIAALHDEGLPMGVRPPSRRQVREVLEVLVEFGGSLNAAPLALEDGSGQAYPRICRSALHYAVENKDHETVHMLAELGADLDEWVINDEAGGIPMDALSRARRLDDQKMMVTLLRCGASDRFLGSDSKGYEPFVGCVVDGLARVVQYYVRERGADLGQRVEGRSLLQLAKSAQTRAVIRALKTEMSVASTINVCVETPRSVGGQTIMSGQSKQRQKSVLSPL